MKMLLLTHNRFALVDDQDYPDLILFKWRTREKEKGGTAYAVRNVKRNGTWRQEWMHRRILDALPNQQVDHIDGNGLNNIRSNLRLASPSQNSANSKKRSGCTSHYKGVSWRAQRGVWVANINPPGQRQKKYLGSFLTEEEAGVAYDEAARGYFGEFARLNFPKRDDPVWQALEENILTRFGSLETFSSASGVPIQITRRIVYGVFDQSTAAEHPLWEMI